MLYLDFNRIELRCKELGWTFYELAKQADMDSTTLYVMHRQRNQNKGNPTLKTVSRLAKALNVSPFYLLKERSDA